MPTFTLTYEDVAFLSNGRDPSTLYIADHQIAEFNASAAGRTDLPKGFVALEEGRVSVDDSVFVDGKDPDGDVKLFVKLGIVVSADSEEEAEAIVFRDSALDAMAELLGEPTLGFEGNWECLDVEETPSAPAP